MAQPRHTTSPYPCALHTVDGRSARSGWGVRYRAHGAGHPAQRARGGGNGSGVRSERSARLGWTLRAEGRAHRTVVTERSALLGAHGAECAERECLNRNTQDGVHGAKRTHMCACAGAHWAERMEGADAQSGGTPWPSGHTVRSVCTTLCSVRTGPLYGENSSACSVHGALHTERARGAPPRMNRSAHAGVNNEHGAPHTERSAWIGVCTGRTPLPAGRVALRYTPLQHNAPHCSALHCNA
jgi:hypothetical protein